MSDSSIDAYAQVLKILHQMVVHLEENNGQRLKASQMLLKQIFRDQILSAGIRFRESLSPGKLQSIHTEMSRDLRLLQTDLMFFSAARQHDTAQQRKQQVGDRLNRLIQYCEFILGEEHPSH